MPTLGKQLAYTVNKILFLTILVCKSVRSDLYLQLHVDYFQYKILGTI